MDRLTMQNYEYAGCEFMDSGIAPVFNRLAAYEDTGLEPEEVKSLKETWDLFGGADGIQSVYVERDEYKQAESEGRLIVLPCKVGDTVWGKYRNNLMPFTVKRIDDPLIHLSNDDEPISLQSWFPANEWGIGVFGSREEAEAALGGDGDG